MPSAPLHHFRPSSGVVVGYVGAAGALAAAAYLVLLERTVGTVRWGLGAAILAVLVWAVLLRPRALVYPGRLLLRHALRDTEIPLQLIEDVRVRQALNVWADGRRYVCTGIGRSTRSLLRGADRGEYEDFVADTVMRLADDARRVAVDTDQQVRRVWALPEVSTLALLGIALGLTLLV